MTAPTQFTAAVEPIEPDLARVRIVGEIDIATADQLKAAIAEAASAGATIIDLSECGFIDSTGLGVLLQAARSPETEADRIVVVCPSPEINDLLSLTAVDQALPTFGSLEDAIAHLNSGHGKG